MLLHFLEMRSANNIALEFTPQYQDNKYTLKEVQIFSAMTK